MIKRRYQPKIGSKREAIYKYVLRNPGCSAAEIYEKSNVFKDFYMILKDLRTLCSFKVLTKKNEKYYEYIEEPEILTEVLIRQQMVFKPLNTFLPTVSPRGQPIERRHFKTCHSKVKPTFKDNL